MITSMKKTMKKLFKILALTALLLSSSATMAGQALSWNLSRDMMTGITTNPKGVWSFMQTQTLHSSGLYTLLPTYSTPCVHASLALINFLNCWQDSTAIGTSTAIGVTTKTTSFSTIPVLSRGIPFLHPGSDRSVVVRWKSPVSGNINLVGRISDIDSSCGDGIDWFVDYQNTTLVSGTIANGAGATFFKQNVPVLKGKSLYFIIDRGINNEHRCDSTNLDVIITHQQ